MKKQINLLLMVFSITMLSCSSPDCTNGVQDGTETNIDCGGDCPPCTATPTAMETSLEGMWYLHRTINHVSGTDYTTLATGSNCKMDLTLNLLQPSNQYRAYGAVGVCSYAGETGWWINSGTGYFNDYYTITLAGDSLKLDHSNGQTTYYYYQ